MEEIDVPSHFLCPISMQLMRDPVTVSTGITYDRANIETWLFSCKNNTCPVTKQVLSDTDPTPNHTLRRLIQSWCIINASHGVERIPTPKQPLDKSQIIRLLNEAKKFPQTQLQCLRRLRSVANGSERNKKCLEATGAVDFLISLMKKNCNSSETRDEALKVLYHLEPSETALKKLLVNDGESEFAIVESLMHALKSESYESRAHAIMLLKSIFKVADPAQLIAVKTEFFMEVVHVLQDKISPEASKAALKILVELCPWGRNRIKAVEAGATSVLIEHLFDTPNKRACELIMVVLDQLCDCAEGRAELLKHGAGLAIVSKKILRVSHVASDRAVRILSSISRFSATARVLQEMLQVGVVSKLYLVLQVDCSAKTKERSRKILSLHSRVWKGASCIPSNVLSSYPSH
ncbi:hypothetical protein RJ639_024353 [Escallonia herrerae]|uniref:U-box domain-containing protein n=1 Tax=Escallonia herrerae TaxID=1293975 RepID=A0AA88V1V5_9ASTE|nr:hypothetical protein RJ639_024353 [Escallonia herrerae]